MWEVHDVTPILDPMQPPGFVRVIVSTTIPVQYHTTAPASDMIVVGKTDGQHSEITGPKPQAPPAAVELAPGEDLYPGEVDPRD